MSSYADVGQNLPAPQTDDQLRKTAASQVDLEIGQSVAPIQSQIDITQDREQKSLGQISGMFNAIQPTVNQAAQAVQQGYNQAEFNQQQIFSQAQANLAQLRGNQASEAQQLSQQIGGPVAMDMFTQPYNSAQQDMINLGAGQELHTMMYAQAGEQQAQQFAGQVFPLVRTEQMASARNQFEDQIRQYQDQITSLQSQRGAQINKRFNDLRTQELQYGLDRANLQLSKLNDQKNYNLEVRKAKDARVEANRTYGLDKQQLNLDITKANRDYQIALRTAGQEDKKIKLAEKQYQIDLANITGKYAGKPTLAAQTLAEETKKADQAFTEQMKAYGLQKQEIDAKIAQAKANTKMELKKFHADQRTEWAGLIENAINPKPGNTVTNSVRVPATAMDKLHNPNMFWDPATHQYMKIISYNQTQAGMQPITDPTRLVDYLLKVVDDPDMTKQRAIDLVRSRLPGLSKSWKYGDDWPPKNVPKGTSLKGLEKTPPMHAKVPGHPEVTASTTKSGKVVVTTGG